MGEGTIALILTICFNIAGLTTTILIFRSSKKRSEGEDWSKKIADAVRPFAELPDTQAEMYAELLVLKKQVEVFWKGVSFSSAQALHSPHTKELDTLLEKFQRDEIQSERDLDKLKLLLKDVAEHDSNPTRKKYALDILTLIHVRFEIGGDLVDLFRKQPIKQGN